MHIYIFIYTELNSYLNLF